MKHYTHPVLPLLIVGVALLSAAMVQSDAEGPAEPFLDRPEFVSSYAHSPARRAPSEVDSYDDLVQGYCVRCHNERRLIGNLTLEDFTLAEAPEQGDVAEKMIHKLLAGMMPPPGAKRPSADSLAGFALALEQRMDAAAAAKPNPGRRPFQRLNLAEYQASVWALLGLDVDVGAFLPPDTKSANFDNIADVQTPSATLIEGYLRAAGQIARVAVGDMTMDPTSAGYRVARTQSQMERAEGAPIGTRGGMSVVHTFPADGQYVFQVVLHSAPEGELYGQTADHEQVEVSIDGERVGVLNIDRWMSDSDPNGMTLLTDSIQVRAGARRVAVAFVRRSDAPVHDLITPVDHTLADTQIGLGYGVTTLPHLQSFAVVGPFRASGVSETATRQRIFTCRPLSAAETAPCAESILRRLGTQAYRRSLTDGDVDALLDFYHQGEAEGGFEGGIRLALQAMLASPHFVFRTEGAAGATPDGVYPIQDVDLASRLSFFLWSAPPDEELLDLANRSSLSNPEVLELQVRRMLVDPRARALSTRFASQWLRLQDLEKVHPDALDYPYYDQILARSMEQETQAFFDYVVREDRSLLELLTADYTFVNERLARHYGIPGVIGSEFRRVSYPDESRRGLLGHGSVLTLTSHANRTSAVLRGKWVMEVLLGSPPPPPPPDVPDLEATEGAEDGRVLTVRERMEQHRANPTCNSCHRMMDPIGLALENFDVTGAWRVKDAGNPVDPVGELYDGTPLTSPADLRAALLQRPEVFLRTFTRNLMAYGIGRRIEYYDMPSVRAITRDAAENDLRMSSFILGVVKSPAFLTSRADVTADEEAGR